jgi:hypothetical protein
MKFNPDELIVSGETATAWVRSVAKGIFGLQREAISALELRRPAEVKPVGDLWEVVTLGVIAAPG